MTNWIVWGGAVSKSNNIVTLNKLLRVLYRVIKTRPRRFWTSFSWLTKRALVSPVLPSPLVRSAARQLVLEPPALAATLKPRRRRLSLLRLNLLPAYQVFTVLS